MWSRGKIIPPLILFMEKPRIIDLPKIEDPRGILTFVQDNHIPFEIKRVFYTYDVPGGESRGSHAHKTLQQIIIAASGSFTVVLDDGRKRHEYFLNHPWQGLYLPPGYWETLADYSSGAVCLVLASQKYNPDDYLYNYDDFMKWLRENGEIS